MSDLFPKPGAYILCLSRATEQPTGINADGCHRCGALVFDPSRHQAWHAAVDTATTTQLPGRPDG